MPLVTLTVRKPKSPAFKDAVLAGVHRALVGAGVPEKDLFHRVLELDAADFRYDGAYPDLASPRGDDFVLIEILLSVGRSVKIKKQIVADIVADLSGGALQLDAEHIMLCFKETAWENWSFGGGRLIHT